MTTMGNRIRQAREAKGLKQSELAELIGVKSDVVISNWESDKNKPKADKMVLLCQVLGISLSWLLDYYGTSDVSVSPTEEALLEKFRALSPHAQETIRILIDREFGNQGEKSET